MDTYRTRTTATILVVDDEEPVRKLVGLILKRSGYAVCTAENGGDALAQAAKQKPDLILMDIAMPEMDGYKATAKLKDNNELADIPVILFSGRPPAEDAGRSFAHGALTYLKKPFTDQQLLGLVALTLESFAD